jgi:hypothetical protein
VRKLEDYISFDLKFPMSWSIPKSMTESDGIVPYDSGSQNLKGISFVCQVDEQNITSTLAKIQRVIKLNKDKEMKEKLFRETIDSLKKTFETTDLETLKRLYIDFESDVKNLENGDQGTSLELVEERTAERPKRTRVRKTETDKGTEES